MKQSGGETSIPVGGASFRVHGKHQPHSHTTQSRGAQFVQTLHLHNRLPEQ